MKIRFWFVKETELARQYCKFAPHPDLGFANAEESDLVWIPKSIVEHRSIRGLEHTLELPDWFIEEKGL